MILYKSSKLIKSPTAKGYPLANYLGIKKAVSREADSENLRTLSENEDGVVINWGMSSKPQWSGNFFRMFFNWPAAVATSSDKLAMFKKFSERGVSTLTYMDNENVQQETIQEFIKRERPIVVRHIVNGHSGAGIEIVPFGDSLPKAPLYTILEDFVYELRLFVVGDRVVDYVQKKKMSSAKLKENGIVEADPVIKTNSSGWVYAHNDIYLLPEAEIQAVKAIAAIGLDFGVVDIGITKDDRALVIETNSSPGLNNPTTITRFGGAISNLILSRG